MRDRLIELINQAEKEFGNTGKPVLDIEEYVSDHLLANGVTIRERGEWKKTCVPDVYQCTKCKRPTKMDIFCDSEVLRAFCPNCGADMRGENNER